MVTIYFFDEKSIDQLGILFLGAVTDSMDRGSEVFFEIQYKRPDLIYGFLAGHWLILSRKVHSPTGPE
jgi:hypothetical protein